MPYFRITILLKSGKLYRGVRMLNTWNPDTAYRMVEKKALDYFGERNLKKLEVVMLPKNSEEVKAFMKK